MLGGPPVPHISSSTGALWTAHCPPEAPSTPTPSCLAPLDQRSVLWCPVLVTWFYSPPGLASKIVVSQDLKRRSSTTSLGWGLETQGFLVTAGYISPAKADVGVLLLSRVPNEKEMLLWGAPKLLKRCSFSRKGVELLSLVNFNSPRSFYCKVHLFYHEHCMWSLRF